MLTSKLSHSFNHSYAYIGIDIHIHIVRGESSLALWSITSEYILHFVVENVARSVLFYLLRLSLKKSYKI